MTQKKQEHEVAISEAKNFELVLIIKYFINFQSQNKGQTNKHSEELQT